MSKSDDEVLVRVEGVSKKFCRSLKKSLWYGVCDIASELKPFGRSRMLPTEHKNLTTDGSDGHGYGTAGGNRQADSGEFLEGHSQAGLQMDSKKLASIRSANDRRDSMDQTGSDSESVLIHDILGNKESIAPDGAGLRDGEFYAVKDVSFELRRGECLGLIGHNGAGKTTLLKMLNGLIKPDAGSITMRGRVGALIALGAGFNPILTGRENIYINGSVLGLTKKEIDAKIDEIIDFAEIREFIDMPVQSYSSGMQVRLGFAVATAMNPDVLILDEVLAVGDGSFRHKCYQRIDSLRGKAAIIFVSHNMPDVGRICQSTVVMERGRTIFQGNALDGIARYNELNDGKGTSKNAVQKSVDPIENFSVSVPTAVKSNEKIQCEISIHSKREIRDFQIEIGFLNEFGSYSAIGIASSQKLDIKLREGSNVFKLEIKSIPLRNNNYSFYFHLINKSGYFIAVEEYFQTVKVFGADELLPSECHLELVNISEN